MTMNGALHPRADVDRLYIPREEGCRVMMSVEEVVRIEECSLFDYLEQAEVNRERVLDVFVKDKGKEELKAGAKEETT